MEELQKQISRVCLNANKNKGKSSLIYQLRNFLLTEFDKNDKASVATLLAALSVLEII